MNSTRTRMGADVSEDLLDALITHRLVRYYQRFFGDEAAAMDHHLSGVDKDNRAEECRLYEAGKEAYESGYRVKFGRKRRFGSEHTVPAAAIQWRLVPAGYVAMVELWQLAYMVKRS